MTGHSIGRGKRGTRGFTLVEALIATVLLAGSTAALSLLYAGGLQAIETQRVHAETGSALRSRMEQLVSQPFGQLANGAGSVTIADVVTPISWTVTTPDMDGDTLPDADARHITITLGNDTLEHLVVDTAGLVGKVH